MTQYSNYLPVKLAKDLLEYGLPLYKYPFGGYDGKPYFDTLDKSDSNWSECDRYRIPTYAEAIDMFSKKGIIIWLEPFRTFSLKGKIGYVWRISFINEETAELVVYREEFDAALNGVVGGSFELTMNDVIKYVIEEL